MALHPVKLARILVYARPHFWGIAGLSAATLAAALLTGLHPWPMKLLIDNVLGDGPVLSVLGSLTETLGISSARDTLLVLVVGAGLLLFAADSALDAITSWGWTVVGRRMTYDLAEDLFMKLQRRSLAYHSHCGTGETITRVGADSWSVYKLFDSIVFKPLHAVLSIAIMAVLMAQLEPLLTLAVLVAAPAMIAASMISGRPMRAASETQRTVEGQIHAHVQQTLVGLPVVRSFGQEQRELARFQGFARSAIRAQQRTTLINGLSGLGSGLVATTGTALVVWACAHQVITGQITIGSLLVFTAYLASLQAQFTILAGIYPAVQNLSASLNRVDDVLRTEPEVMDRRDAGPLPRACGRVQFEGVTFGYEPDRSILRDVSLDVGAGQTIALVGPTGAGKSTLVSLIPRFFDPTKGRVLIDGHDLRDVQLASLRSQVALVLQEPFLFPLTIAENIAYGRPGASQTEIEAAACAANAHGFISRLPQGYDTVLGERGATLSGGERQRLSIARALLKDAPILILDEPTSALDAGTEALIMEAMRNLVRGRTTFIIAHRLATIRTADRIVVLHEGVVVESGSHQQLISQDGMYARFVGLQFSPQPQLVPS